METRVAAALAFRRCSTARSAASAWSESWPVGEMNGGPAPDSDIVPFRVAFDPDSDRRPPRAPAEHALAGARDRRRLVAGDPARVRAGPGAVLVRRVRLRRRRGADERVAAVHDAHRRPRHPLRARPLAGTRRGAAGHHARLARLGRRVLRRARSVDRSGRPRRRRRRRVPRRVPVDAGLRVQRPAVDARPRGPVDRAGMGDADEPARVRALRRAGRRLGLGGDHAPSASCTPTVSSASTSTCRRCRSARSPTTRPSSERANFDDFEWHTRWGTGYQIQQSTRPQTLGYGLVDSPVGQLAWIVEKFWAWTDCDGDPLNIFTRDQLLDNVTVYWFTGTGASSGRLYWESAGPAPPVDPAAMAALIGPSPFRPAAPSSRARSVGRHDAGPSSASRTSTGGTSRPKAATSPRSSSRHSSSTRCGPRSVRCDEQPRCFVDRRRITSAFHVRSCATGHRIPARSHGCPRARTSL